jgi:hypothetical protein
MAFCTTPAKDRVRSELDREEVRAFRVSIGRRLTYFGLPGALALDVRDWLPYLDHVIGVERDAGRCREMQQMLAQVLPPGAFEVYRGAFDDVIKNRRDDDGTTMGSLRADLYNLDYEGPLIIRRRSGPPSRIETIRAILGARGSRSEPLLLLMTANLRQRDKGEVAEQFEDLRESMGEGNSSAQECLEWYGHPGNLAERLKVSTIRVVRTAAAGHGLRLSKYIASTYIGFGKVRMMHYIFRLEPSTRADPSTRPTDREILQLPLVEYRNFRLVPSEAPPPF